MDLIQIRSAMKKVSLATGRRLGQLENLVEERVPIVHEPGSRDAVGIWEQLN